jgi:Protein of unknown function (DUF2608)
MLQFLTAFALLTVIPAHAEIYEVASFRDPQVQMTLAAADTATWVIFDIDNTLIKSASMIGSPQWSDYVKGLATAAGKKKHEAEVIQHASFRYAQLNLRVETTEAAAPPMIIGLQKRLITSFALTARDQASAAVTTAQLRAAGYNFTGSQPTGSPEARLYSGVLFASGVSKGGLLKKLMTKNQSKPTHVIFFDDRHENLESVGNELSRIGVKFTGFRYGAVDKDVENFRSDIANVQWVELKRTGQSLSNTETLQRILSTPNIPEDKMDLGRSNN